ncbi:SAM-dependent methyltransferase [Nocardia tengchongensis]|uniref:SAM-dependent methyltransferase n=1 Tax=Nocardia tengchongensis TaxID=2055889 RepID=UPI0036464DFB
MFSKAVRRLLADDDLVGPNQERVHNYLMGRNDNCGHDRAVGDQLAQRCPTLGERLRAEWDFLHSANAELADLGMHQFMELGVGFPVPGWNLHDTVTLSYRGPAEVQPRVVYVAADRLVATHGRAMLVNYALESHERPTDFVVYDAEIAYRTLLDTIRADKVHRCLVRERTDRASEYLRQARADYDALDAAAQFTSGRARLLAAAERVARWEGVPSSVIQAHARLDDTDAAALERALAEHPGFTPLYLDIPAVAERIGVDPATMRSYKSRGMMPPPGMEVSDRPAWEWDVIERWVKDRRGQAWAAGTTADETGRRS